LSTEEKGGHVISPDCRPEGVRNVDTLGSITIRAMGESEDEGGFAPPINRGIYLDGIIVLLVMNSSTVSLE